MSAMEKPSAATTTTVPATSPDPDSRLLCIPTEVRLSIIEDLIPTQRHRFYILPESQVYNNLFFQTFHSNKAYFGLLVSCKQLHAELTAAVRERITFEFYIEGPVRPRAVARHLGSLASLPVVKSGVQKAVVKICSWQWLMFEPLERFRVLQERVAVVLHAINKPGTLKSVRLEVQEDVHDDANPVLAELVARFSSQAAPGGKKTLQSKQGVRARYRADEAVDQGTPLVKSVELHELQTWVEEPTPATANTMKLPTRQRWVERGHLQD